MGCGGRAEIVLLEGHDGAVFSAAFSPDGARIVTASADGTARIWDAATGSPVGEPLRQRDAVFSAAFSPDGARIVTAWRTRPRVFGIQRQAVKSRCFAVTTGQFGWPHSRQMAHASGPPHSIGQPDSGMQRPASKLP